MGCVLSFFSIPWVACLLAIRIAYGVPRLSLLYLSYSGSVLFLSTSLLWCFFCISLAVFSTVCVSICASFVSIGLRFVFARVWSSFFWVTSGSFRFPFLCHKLCNAWLPRCVLFTYSFVLSSFPRFSFVFCLLPLFRDFSPVCYRFYLLSLLTFRICPVVCLFLLCVLVVRSGVFVVILCIGSCCFAVGFVCCFACCLRLTFLFCFVFFSIHVSSLYSVGFTIE